MNIAGHAKSGCLRHWVVAIITYKPGSESSTFLLCVRRHSLHIISDEIYMLSIFKEGVSTKSALAVKG